MIDLGRSYRIDPETVTELSLQQHVAPVMPVVMDMSGHIGASVDDLTTNLNAAMYQAFLAQRMAGVELAADAASGTAELFIEPTDTGVHGKVSDPAQPPACHGIRRHRRH